MRIIVGLGNPGTEYAGTRHNLGFNLIAELASRLSAEQPRLRPKGLMARATHQGEPVVLFQPLTYMNLSGQAVKPLAASLGVQPEEILVASDDLDLPLGQIRLRAGGGAGGHRGVASIIENLGSPDFARLRMGIGRPPQDMDVVDYVLRRFDQEDGAVARDMIENAAAAAVTWVEVGITEAMNRYNRKLAADARHEEGE